MRFLHPPGLDERSVRQKEGRIRCSRRLEVAQGILDVPQPKAHQPFGIGLGCFRVVRSRGEQRRLFLGRQAHPEQCSERGAELWEDLREPCSTRTEVRLRSSQVSSRLGVKRLETEAYGLLVRRVGEETSVHEDIGIQQRLQSYPGLFVSDVVRGHPERVLLEVDPVRPDHAKR